MYTGFMGGFYKISEWIMKFAYVNILWVAFSLLGLLIFGFFPATVALFAVVRKWVQLQADTPVFKTFWTTYKQEFLKSNLLGIILCIIGYILYLDFALVRVTPIDLLQLTYFPLLVIVLLYFLTVLYVFPVFVHYDVKTLYVLKNAFLIMIMRPPITIMMVVGTIAVYFLMRTLPGLIPFFAVSILAYVLMWSSNLAFAKIQRLQENSEDTPKEQNS